MSDFKANAAAQKERFLSAWPTIKSELVAHLEQNGMPDDARAWFGKSLDYNAPGGKLNRGISVIDTAEILLGRPLSDEKDSHGTSEFYRAAILGWGVELLQAYFLVSDDMMDASITRRGQPCWYRVPAVGNIAINDSFMLESSIYFLIKKHLRSDPAYVDYVELFLETTFQTELGQLVDLLTAPEDDVNLDRFSLKKHQLIVTYKTAFYSFYLPVALAMHFVGIKDEKLFKQAKDILIPLGEYFQVQDDYLDCFGTHEQIGKIGTDILDNKCSWCVNIALSVATPEQRKLLDENYGRKDSAAEAQVKELYHQLELPRRYDEYEQATYVKLNELIDAIPEETGLKRDVFRSFLSKIYKRSK
ncbi:Farnesyl pyrophosphate synthetase [Ceratobasidium sp. 394]|nr:Farnesyl pyrophosphate synthetase [Ceratobasidium sp. 394]KAG9097409.1 Farnesyl pyrophosphate synthetase [Ceratobasidium sp. UAMH 11750]